MFRKNYLIMIYKIIVFIKLHKLTNVKVSLGMSFDYIFNGADCFCYKAKTFVDDVIEIGVFGC
jgi:hypothetical protein